MSEVSLDEVFSGDDVGSEPAPAPEVEAPQEAAAPEAAAEAPAVEPEPTGDDSAPPAPEATQESHTVPLQVLLDERAKRQEAESSLASFEKQNAADETKVADENRPEFLDDPDEYLKNFKADIYRDIQDQQIRRSVSAAKEAHKDYDAVIEQWNEAVQANPVLEGQMRGSMDPAEFAYKAGKAYAETKDMGDLSEYRAKIKDQVRAELIEEAKKTKADEAAQRIIPSNASARGAGAISGAALDMDTSIDGMFSD